MTTRNFSELEAKIDSRRVARAKANARRVLAGMFIVEMRRRSGMTQTQLATMLGVKQPAIARMEQQDDLQLSTLQRIIEALGGKLKITAELPGGRVQLLDAGRQSRRAA